MSAKSEPIEPKRKQGRTPKPAKCKYCKIEFPSTRIARNHQWGDECPKKPATATRGRPTKEAKCPWCKKTIDGVRKMQAHRKECLFKPKRARKIASTKRKTA